MPIEKKKLVTLSKFRLDFQNTVYGNDIPNVIGLYKEDKFSRYEIQENGNTPKKSSIACVYIPLHTMKGEVVVDAFNRSMGATIDDEQRIAIIRKKDK